MPAIVVLDLPRMRTEVGGTAVELTPTEFQLLADPRGTARAHLHARPAARRAPRRGVRDLRAGDRLAHQEPAPQARARSAPAALRPDGVRRRLPVRRRPGDRLMSVDGRRRPPDWRRGDWSRGPGPWGPGRRGRGPWRGFGCLFGLVFLVVAGSLVAASAFVLSQLGPLPGLVALLLVVAVLVAIGRTFRATGETLDELVEATRRVEAGDYSVRVGTPRGRQSLGPSAGPRLRHDGGPPRDRRAPAPDAARRGQPRAADAADRRPGQPRGDHRRRLPGRSGPSRAHPRRDPGPRPTDRRPADAGPVRGGDAGPPRRTDRPGDPRRPTSSARSNRPRRPPR